MENLFPEPILKLPKADIAIEGLEAYLSQGENHQILYMKFSEDVDLAEHSQDEQWGGVLEGKIELSIQSFEGYVLNNYGILDFVSLLLKSLKKRSI
ncbi:hypothetical protein JYU11_02155 [bacterium AH-315-G05]|nr:hypothetical protein [bacterium AH-315-L21]MBN4062862.1 hypothetical protein [Alkaliphilus sp. AH-315-G20]MBN4069688.1 hypothetical protein [bacterium AH-315-G05]